jgi:exonuclease VII large subunit
MDIYTSIASSKEYAKQMEKLQKKYTELNAMIVSKHDQVSQVRSDIIRKNCENTLDSKNVEGATILPSYLSALLSKVQTNQKSLDLIHDEIKEDLQKEEQDLHDQIVSSREFFKRFEKVIGEKYEQQMNKLFEYELQLDNASLIYFLSKPSTSLVQLQTSSSRMDKINSLGKLWDDLIVGEAKFKSESGPQSINWQVMSDSLKNAVMMEAL